MSRSFIHLWYVSCSIVEFCGNSFVKSSVRLLCLAGTKVDLPQKKKKNSDQLNALKVALAFFVMLIGFKPFFFISDAAVLCAYTCSYMCYDIIDSFLKAKCK